MSYIDTDWLCSAQRHECARHNLDRANQRFSLAEL
jgi:hypothetical protein